MGRHRSAAAPVIQFLSSISFEFYLIHHVVIRCYDFYGAFPRALYNINWVVNVLYMLVVSIVLSWLYQTCTRFLKNIWHKRTA